MVDLYKLGGMLSPLVLLSACGWLLLLAGQGAAEVPAINQVMDGMLDDIRDELTANGNSVIPGEDFEADFSYRIFEFKLKSNIECKNGTLRNFSSIGRTGDTVITNVLVANGGNQVSLMVPIGLKELGVEWEKCRIQIKHLISQTKQVSADYGENFVVAEIHLTQRPGLGCNATLTRLQLSDPCRITVDGGGLVGFVLDRIYPAISEFIKSRVEGVVRAQLRQLIANHIPTKRLCETVFKDM